MIVLGKFLIFMRAVFATGSEKKAENHSQHMENISHFDIIFNIYNAKLIKKLTIFAVFHVRKQKHQISNK